MIGAYVGRWCAVLCPPCLRLWTLIARYLPFRLFLDMTIAMEALAGPYWAYRGVDAVWTRPDGATNWFGTGVVTHWPWASTAFVAVGVVQAVLFLRTYRRVHRPYLRIARRFATFATAMPMLFYGLALHASPLRYEAIQVSAYIYLAWSVLLLLAVVKDGGDVA